MTERKESLKIVEGVREKAARIIDSSHDLIQIDETAIETVLIPRIQKFLENQKAEGWAPAGGELPVEQELGVNLFLDVINFCYKDPYSGHEYAYTNPGQFKRATGLLQALVDSGVDWNDFSKVSAISAKQWTEIVQLSPNNPMYLGEERGERLVKMADYLLSQGIPTMTDLLDSIDYDAINLVEFLQDTGLFIDEFQKRSQLAARMVSNVLTRRQMTPLSGVENLTVMADYRIPQVFYNLPGVVTIKSDDLLYNLVYDVPLDPGSREEQALRATSVTIGKTVAEKMGVMEADVDGYLWGLSQEMVKRGEMSIQHMMVATDAY